MKFNFQRKDFWQFFKTDKLLNNTFLHDNYKVLWEVAFIILLVLKNKPK